MHRPEKVVADSVGRFFRGYDLKIQYTVNIHAHVVPGNTGLLGYVEHLLLERTLISDNIQKGNQQMKTGIEHCAELAEALHYIGLLVGDNLGRF